MIVLYDKYTEKPVSIYKIKTNEKGYNKCLVWVASEWKWMSIDCYIPCEETQAYRSKLSSF